MKKTLLLTAAGFLALPVFSQAEYNPIVKMGFYSQRISPNGVYVGSMADEAAVYNVETNETVSFPYTFLGLGNSVANNGIAVGSSSDVGLIFTPRGAIFPKCLEPYSFSSFNAITPDGSRACGYVGMGIEGLLPFYVDLDNEGNAGELHLLPHPEKDFTDGNPTYILACGISADGKTIIGEIVDYGGRLTDPIVYSEDAEGSWSFSLPSEKYFNPEHIELPPNPFVDEPHYPEFTEYMNPDSAEIYMEEYEAYVMGYGEYPDPFDFMTDEEIEAYMVQYNIYWDWYNANEEYIKPYLYFYNEVVKTTVSYGLNDIVIAPDASWFAVTGSYGTDDETAITPTTLYKFDVATGIREEIANAPSGVYPSQILPDNTLIVATPMQWLANTYILLPDAEKFLGMQAYYEQTHPAYLDWMRSNIGGETGLVCVSDDFSTFAAGVQSYQYFIDPGYLYSSYIFTSHEIAGVENIVAESEDGIYRVYNIHGMNVLNTRNVAEINNLANGIYIVNGKKMIVRK